MRHFLIAGGCLFLVLFLLWIEHVAMNRIRSAITFRFVVVGTRGKTSVTRLIAAGLREGGVKVLAKTTGSEARVVLPDGNEQPIRRWGINTPLEQRSVLRLAARLGCDAVVLEAMSIRPESLRVELGQIILPQTVVVTNIHLDHVAEMCDPGEVFSMAIPAGATALLPASFPDAERGRLTRRGVQWCAIDVGEAESLVTRFPHPEWPQNLALALAACERVGVPIDTALQGMAGVRMDVGAMGAWLLRGVNSSATWTVVNAFATNDPHSAKAALERSFKQWPTIPGEVVGLLNLRGDRADRTEQWMDAFNVLRDVFDRLVVCGSVPLIVQWRLARRYGPRAAVVRSRNPARIMAEAVRLSPSGGHLFGFGNLGGAGIRLVNYWQERGEPA